MFVRDAAHDGADASSLMEGEYHKLYGSAGLMMVNEVHGKIEKK